MILIKLSINMLLLFCFQTMFSFKLYVCEIITGILEILTEQFENNDFLNPLY